MEYLQSYNDWLNDEYFDEKTKQELKELSGNETEVKERFYKNLEFGTGGLRGIIGAGTNRMNIYTVRKATQGFANYIKKNADNFSAVIAYDCRRMSKEFAVEAALVFAANGIKTHVFQSLRPTPELSFAIRFLKCQVGIVITASHNPPEYNGYKAYWSDGGQIPYPRDEEIIDEVNLVEKFSEIKTMNLEEAKVKGLYEEIGEEVDRSFIDKVKEQSLDPDLIKRQKDLKIVYTPLHGTGNLPVRRVLSEVGFENVHVVKEQELPDGNFPTVNYPNPEDPKAFKLAIDLAKSIDADLIVATDPDADRVGAAVKVPSGEYVNLTGNNTAVLIAEYILSKRKSDGTLPGNAAVISTIVSTDMAKSVCKAYDVTYLEVLTGFKYIGEKIKEFEMNGDHTFIFGFEESYGLLSGTHARDKDAVVASLLLCEVAAYYKDRGMTMYDGLQELYKKYGYYLEASESITLKGIEGVENIKKIMETLRNEPPTEIVKKVVESRDYKNSVAIDSDGTKTKINLPVSDVLYYVLDDESWVCVRPSGTEPKIKIYFGVKDKTLDDAKAKMKEISSCMMSKVNGIL